MIKKIVPYILSPVPVITLLLGCCIWIYISPEHSIDGRPDNAPDRAAIVIATIILPFIIYPMMIIVTFIQTSLMKLIHQHNLKGCLIIGFITSSPIAVLFAKAIHAPQFNESLAKAISYSVIGFSIISITTLLVCYIINKKIANQWVEPTVADAR